MAEKQGALSKAWNQGLNELAAANRGEMAMGAPPIQPPQAVSYEEALSAAPRATPAVDRSQGMER